MLKVAMLSYWHVHAPDYTRQLQELDDVKITAIWDEETDRGKKWANDLAVIVDNRAYMEINREVLVDIIKKSEASMRSDILSEYPKIFTFLLKSEHYWLRDLLN